MKLMGERRGAVAPAGAASSGQHFKNTQMTRSFRRCVDSDLQSGSWGILVFKTPGQGLGGARSESHRQWV